MRLPIALFILISALAVIGLAGCITMTRLWIDRLRHTRLSRRMKKAADIIDQYAKGK